MIAKIHTCSFEAGLQTLQNPQASPKTQAWIGIFDNFDKDALALQEKLRNHKIRTKLGFFTDVCPERCQTRFANAKGTKPTRKKIQQITYFLQTLMGDKTSYNLTINCHYGLSRSNSIAMAALLLQGHTPETALNYILTLEPSAWLNLEILKHTDYHLKQNAREFVKNWQTTQLQKTI
jgi:predicted protein tyrosine phosphatase